MYYRYKLGYRENNSDPYPYYVIDTINGNRVYKALRKNDAWTMMVKLEDEDRRRSESIEKEQNLVYHSLIRMEDEDGRTDD